MNDKPSFFKVLIGYFSEQLMIPPEFPKRFPEIFTIARFFYLKPQTGRSDRVSVSVNEEGHYFFKRGWPEFVRNHDLQEREFLLFNYVGDTTFDVVIYARSACEKDNIELEQCTVPEATTTSTAAVRNTQQKYTKKPQVSHRTICETSVRERAVEGIGSVTPNHTAFIRVIKYYECYDFILPRRFAREAGLVQKKVTCIKDPEGRQWTISIHNNSQKQVRFSTGWREFLDTNNIVPGDIVEFHLMRDQDSLIQVNIVKKGHEDIRIEAARPLKEEEEEEEEEEDCIVIDGSQRHKRQKNNGGGGSRQRKKEALRVKEKYEALKRSNRFKSKNPSFKLVIQPSYVPPRSRLNVPSHFSKKFFKDAEGELILTVPEMSDGREWIVRYTYDEARGHERRKILGGWGRFAKQNGVKVGDVCVFELIDANPIKFKVIIL